MDAVNLPSHWVTVVIPTRDRPGLVGEAVRSALAAGRADVIVVDDSPVPSAAVAALQDEVDHVTVVGGGGRGPSAARNIGARRATTDWLVFLDDDDVLDPAGLDMVRSALDACRESPSLVMCTIALRTQRDGAPEVQPLYDLGPVFRHARGVLAAGGFGIRRDLFDELGGYEPTLRHSENTELLLRAIEHCARHSVPIESVDSVLAVVWRRAPTARLSNDAFALKHAAQFMLESHREAFAREPAAVASLHRVSGVNAARLGDFAEASGHFRDAATLGGRRTDTLRRCLVRVPLLRSYVWRPVRSSG